MGGLILGFRCAQQLKIQGLEPEVFVSANDEIFAALSWLFGDLFTINKLQKDITEESFEFLNLQNHFDELYFVCPDLTFNNKFAFDYLKYGLSLQSLVQTRFNTEFERIEKRINLSLNSNTEGYSYSKIGELAIELARQLPEYIIDLPILNNWAGKDIPPVTLPTVYPNNLKIHHNPNLIESIENLLLSCYCVCADNGFSHIAHAFHKPRLLLDSRVREPHQSYPWLIRWKEDISESVDISLDIANIVNIIKTNLEVPQTQLLPRNCLINNFNVDWKRLLLIK